MSDEQARSNGETVRSDRSGIGYLLNQSARAVRAQVADQLRNHGLDDTDFILLRNCVSTFKSSGSGVLTSEISQSHHLPVSELDASARKLVRDGWLRAKSVEGSDRLIPTRKALSVMPAIQDVARWTLEKALNGFTAEEIETLTTMLRRIIRNTSTTVGGSE